MQQLLPKSVHPSNRGVAEENEISTLRLVHLYGHARRTEIARALWPTSSARMSEKMAQRTVGRLTFKRQLVDRTNILGGLSLVLAKDGAARLREWGVNAHAGGDLSSITGAQFCHRTLGTNYLIDRQLRGHSSYGEHAIANGQAPVSQHELERRFNKLPDGLVFFPGNSRGYTHEVLADWIEVEFSRKSYQELARILTLAWESGGWLNDAQTVILDRIVFVYDGRRGHETSITKALQRYLLARPHPDPNLVLSSIALARCKIRTPLVWCGHEEVHVSVPVGTEKIQLNVKT